MKGSEMHKTTKLTYFTILLSFIAINSGCSHVDRAYHPPRTVSSSIIISYNYPYYYDRPFYFYNGIYYYGGNYIDGYYYFKDLKLYGGHYYYNGYRYHHHERYRAVNGEYGYYINKATYENSLAYKNPVRHEKLKYGKEKRSNVK